MPCPARRSARLAWIVLPLGLAATSGCVSHVPMSETVLFHTPQTTPRSTRVMSRGLTVTASPTKNFGTGAYTPHFDIYGTTPNNTPYSVGGYFTAYLLDGVGAISATAGLGVVGLDATAKLTRRTYAVVGASMPREGQVWLMHRTYNSPRTSVALGGGYMRRTLVFDDEGALFIDRPVDVAAVRGFVLSHPSDPSKGVQLGVSVGYAPSLRQTTATVSLSVGSF